MCFVLLYTFAHCNSKTMYGQVGWLVRKMQDLEGIYKKWFQDPTRKRTDCFKTLVSGRCEATWASRAGKLPASLLTNASIRVSRRQRCYLLWQLNQKSGNIQLCQNYKKKSNLNESTCMHTRVCYYIQWF